MKDVMDRKAYFKSAVAFYDGNISKVFIGIVYGEITNYARGTHGFGFDPIFKPKDSTQKTFAEMTLKEKCMYSHRAKSITKFCIWFNNLLGSVPNNS
jgi:XTP/dITP diphosphohydrolase